MEQGPREEEGLPYCSTAGVVLKNQRNILQAGYPQSQPLLWADCHIRSPHEQVLVRGVVIPHIDTPYPGTRGALPSYRHVFARLSAAELFAESPRTLPLTELRMRLPLRCALVVILLLPVFSPAGHAQSRSSAPGGGIQLQAERELNEGRTTLDPGALAVARNAFSNCIQEDPRSDACYYGRARAWLYEARAQTFAHHAEAAAGAIDHAIPDAQKAIALDGRFADAHALLSDLYGQKITGAFSGMRYGPKANEESSRALQLDPNNAQAYAVLGRKYLYAPAMFGGSIDKAIESFRRATALDPRSDEDYVWLAMACRKKGDTAGAQQALAQALRLNSRSVFARRVQSGGE